MNFYQYPRCSTCRKAKKWLQERELWEQLEADIDLVEEPPSRQELERMWEASGEDLRKLFNTRGKSWRELGLKERWEELTDDERLDLLAADGKLIRRPLLDLGDDVLIGFGQKQWAERLG